MKNPILEYTPKGWIKLHRELEGKGIFKEPDLLQLYIYLMFHAMTDDTEYRGVIISRGQLALTYGSLSKTLNISQRRVRTLLGFGTRIGMFSRIFRRTFIHHRNYLQLR